MMALMPSCRDVVQIHAAGDAKTAPFWRRALMRLHVANCDMCARFLRQLSLVAENLRQSWKAPQGPEFEAFKRRVLDRLRAG